MRDKQTALKWLNPAPRMPILTEDFAQRVREAVGNFPDDFPLENLFNPTVIVDYHLQEYAESWDRFWAGLSSPQRGQLSRAVQAAYSPYGKMSFKTLGDIRGKTLDRIWDAVWPRGKTSAATAFLYFAFSVTE